MRLLITNISELVVVQPGPLSGAAMDRIERLTDAALLVENGRIAWFGPASGAPAADQTLDAAGGCVVPGLVDCHTHAVFAGSREAEFVERIRGKSYHEIAEAGGGIKATVEAVRQASEAELVALARPRLERMLRHGVTTVEIKSGYGLTVADELKMLRVVKALARQTAVEIVATYLAAHTVPAEYAGRADEYLRVVYDDKVMAQISGEALAEFCDAFCEKGAFGVEQSRFVLQAGLRHGLRPKLHADQLSQIGASRLAAELGAASADHLEFVDDESIAALRQAGTIPVLLPGCSFFLDSEPAPARRLIEAGLPVALATDYNPGSCTIDSLPLIMSIACTRLRMTPTEALVACTANAAAAIGRQGRVGAIAVGHQADLVILDVPNVDAWPYNIGRNCVHRVFKCGKGVVSVQPA